MTGFYSTYLVTARGCDSRGKFDAHVRQYVRETLTRWGLHDCGLLIDENHSFADPKRKQIDKVAQRKSMNITLLMDDDEKNIHKVRQAKFSAIHFGVEAQNWQEVIAQIDKS